MANIVILMGRLGRDPEITYTADGLAICKFSLATSEYKDKTEWHNMVGFGKTAELCSEYLSKGSQAHFEGRLQTSSWEKDNVTRYRTEIVIKNIEFVGKSKPDSADVPPKQRIANPAGQKLAKPNDDIPF